MNDNTINIIVAIIGCFGSIVSAIIGAHWARRPRGNKVGKISLPELSSQDFVQSNAQSNRNWFWFGLFGVMALMISCFCGYLSLISVVDILNSSINSNIYVPQEPVCWLDPYYLIPVCQ